jgi:hypothetical protein
MHTEAELARVVSPEEENLETNGVNLPGCYPNSWKENSP